MIKINKNHKKINANSKIYSYTFSEIYFINYALKNK